MTGGKPKMKLIAHYNNFRFEIEEDFPDVGFYLYVFDDNNTCIANHLLNNESMAKEFALEEYGVLLDSW